jgi:colanic acid/amylovoran biosynthesis glycosyltransferase
MRIAVIVGGFPSLSETFILRQITGLIDRGHEVDIFAGSAGNDPVRHPDIEKYRLLTRTHYLTQCACSEAAPLRILKRLGLIFANFHKNPTVVLRTFNVAAYGKAALFLQILCQIVPFLDKGPYDILHCQFGPIGEFGLLLRDTGVFHGKIVTSFRGFDISSYVKEQGDNTYEDLFRRGDLFLCVSEHIKADLIRLGCDREKIIVHRSGIDPNTFNVIRREPKTAGKTTILTIARLVEKKGVEYGIEAVAKIAAKYPEVEYKIAGDGPLRDKLQLLIAKLNVGDKIELLGWRSQDQIAQLLERSDILLTPSLTSSKGDQEGIPGVIMEAFATGLPVVSTEHAGIPELVQDGASGFLVPEKDVDALIQKLEILIEQPQLRYAMGRTGRKFVEQYYNIETLNNRLVEVYQELLRGEFALAHL